MIPSKPKMQQQQQRIPGIRCPHCGNLIPTSIQQILFSNCLFCPTCGLRLNIDKKKSDKALKILAKVDEAQRRVEESSQLYKSSNLLENNNTDNIEITEEEINNAISEIVLVPRLIKV